MDEGGGDGVVDAYVREVEERTMSRVAKDRQKLSNQTERLTRLPRNSMQRNVVAVGLLARPGTSVVQVPRTV